MTDNNDDLDSENELKRKRNLEEWEEPPPQEEDKKPDVNPSAWYYIGGGDFRKILELISVVYVVYLFIRFLIYLIQKLFGIEVDEEKLPDFHLLKVVGLLLGTIFLVYIVVWLILKFT